MRRGGAGRAHDDGAGIQEIRAGAVEYLLAGGVDNGIQIDAAIARRLHHHDAQRRRQADRIVNRGLDLHRNQAVAEQGGLRFQQQHVAEIHHGDGVENGLRGTVAAARLVLANAADRSQRRRNANAADSVVHRRNFSQNAASVKEVGMVQARNKGDAVRCEIFMIEGPPPFHIHERLPGAIASGKIPGILGIDAIGGGVQIALVAAARVIRGIDERGLDRRRLDIGGGNRIPSGKCRGQRLDIRSPGRIDDEINVQVGRACCGIECLRALGENAKLIGLLHGEERRQRDARKLRRQFAPWAGAEAFRHPGGILPRQPDMILEFDDDAAAVACNRLPVRIGRVAAFVLCHEDLPDDSPILYKCINSSGQ